MRIDLEQPSEHITGQVRSSVSNELEVTTQIGQVCGSCSAKCGGRQSPRSVAVLARAQAPIQRGQAVFLDLASGALAQISLSLYLLPAIGLLAGAFCSYALGLGDLPQAVTGVVGLLLGLQTARVFLRRQYLASSPLRAVQINDK